MSLRHNSISGQIGPPNPTVTSPSLSQTPPDCDPIRPPPLPLPQELIDLVIDHLRGDFASLKSCALTARSLAHRSSYQLHYRTVVDDRWLRRHLGARRGKSPYPFSRLAEYVGDLSVVSQDMSICGDYMLAMHSKGRCATPTYQATLMHIISQFKRVKRLLLHVVDMDFRTLPILQAAPLCGTVNHLTLRAIRFPTFVRLQNVLSVFAGLSSLSFTNVSFEPRLPIEVVPAGALANTAAMSSLQHIQVHSLLPVNSHRNLLALITSLQAARPDVLSISYHFNVNLHAAENEKFFRDAGRSIVHLTMSYECGLEVENDPLPSAEHLGIQHCNRLCSLKFILRGALLRRNPQWLSQVLSQLSSLHLTAIRLEVYDPRIRHILERDLLDVDQMLETKPFKNLTKFAICRDSLDITTHWVVSIRRFRMTLARTCMRGILVFSPNYPYV